MRYPVLGLAFLAGLFIATPIGAQTAQKFSVQGSFLYAQLGGSSFDQQQDVDTQPGTGFELQVRYNPSALSIGVGYQYTTHPIVVTGFEDVDIEDEYAGIFIEPRYVIFIGNDFVAPYVSGRLMSLSNTFTIRAEGFDDFVEDYDAWGWTFGGGGLVRLGSRINADIGFTAGQVTLIFDDPTLEENTDTGFSSVFRVGVAVGI